MLPSAGAAGVTAAMTVLGAGAGLGAWVGVDLSRPELLTPGGTGTC